MLPNISKWSNTSDGYISDSCAPIFNSARVNNEAVPFLPSPLFALCFRSEHGVPPGGSVGHYWPGRLSAGAAHRPGCRVQQEDQGELRGGQERRYRERKREGGGEGGSAHSALEYKSLVMT